eukprot:12922295-Prorocentrum_lima.AAC.1
MEGAAIISRPPSSKEDMWSSNLLSNVPLTHLHSIREETKKAKEHFLWARKSGRCSVKAKG